MTETEVTAVQPIQNDQSKKFGDRSETRQLEEARIENQSADQKNASDEPEQKGLCCGCPCGQCFCLSLTITLMVVSILTSLGLILSIVFAFLSVNYSRGGAWNPVAPFMDPLGSQTCGNFITIFSLFVKGVMALFVFACETGLFYAPCFNNCCQRNACCCQSEERPLPHLIKALRQAGFRGFLYVCIGAVTACSVSVSTPSHLPNAVRTAIVVTTNLAPPMLVLCGVLYCCIGLCCCCNGDYCYHRRKLLEWKRKQKAVVPIDSEP